MLLINMHGKTGQAFYLDTEGFVTKFKESLIGRDSTAHLIHTPVFIQFFPFSPFFPTFFSSFSFLSFLFLFLFPSFFSSPFLFPLFPFFPPFPLPIFLPAFPFLCVKGGGSLPPGPPLVTPLNT